MLAINLGHNKSTQQIKVQMNLFSRLAFLALFLTIFPTSSWSDSISAGSGFFITADGHFATNFHVITGASSIVIRDSYGKTLPAAIVRVDQANDLAILKVSGSFQPIPIESSSLIKIGTGIVTVGFPLVNVQGLEPKVTDGIINSLTGINDDPRYFQISAGVQKGNSGGPLLDMHGNVIGIVSAKLGAMTILKVTGDLAQNVNYAIKSNYLLELVRSLNQVQSGLPASNEKKLEDISAVYSSIEHSVALVIAIRKSSVPAPQPTTNSEPMVPGNSNDKVPSAKSQEERLKEDALFTATRYFAGTYSCKEISAPAALKGELLRVEPKGNVSLTNLNRN